MMCPGKRRKSPFHINRHLTKWFNVLAPEWRFRYSILAIKCNVSNVRKTELSLSVTRDFSLSIQPAGIISGWKSGGKRGGRAVAVPIPILGRSSSFTVAFGTSFPAKLWEWMWLSLHSSRCSTSSSGEHAYTRETETGKSLKHVGQRRLGVPIWGKKGRLFRLGKMASGKLAFGNLSEKRSQKSDERRVEVGRIN